MAQMTAEEALRQLQESTGKSGEALKELILRGGEIPLSYANKMTSPIAQGVQGSLVNNLSGLADVKNTGALGKMARFAGSPAALNILKGATGLSAVGGVLGAADVVAGPDSGANKLMDTAAMGIGGVLGSVGGPMGIAAGAGLGKAASDAVQYIFGDKKSAEQRKLEEALMLLRGGNI